MLVNRLGFTADEADVLRYQIGTSKKGRGGRRYLSYVFTEPVEV